MPKSKKRKGHKKRVARRNQAKAGNRNKLVNAIKELQGAALEEQALKRTVAKTTSEEGNSTKLSEATKSTEELQFNATPQGALNLSEALSQATSTTID